MKRPSIISIFLLVVLTSICFSYDTELLYPPPVYTDDGIFVSTTGSDISGNGTIDQPFKTIQHVLDHVSGPGDTIILRSGLYSEAVRIRDPHITIRSKSDEWAVIQTPTDNPDISSTVIIDVDADYAKLQRLEIIGGYYYGIMLWTKWDWGDPNDRTGVSHVTIEDCEIHHTGRDCIKITPGCDHVKILRTHIHHSGVRYSGNAEGIDNVNGDYMAVSDCYIHDIATTAIYFKGGATGCIAQRNIIDNCGGAGILLGFDTSPEFFDLDVNPLYYENINGIARNNIVINTQYSGIGMYAALNPRVFNNTIINTSQSAHSAIYFGLAYQDWDPDAGRPSTVNPAIKNNIALQYGKDMVFIRYSNDLGGMSALTGMPVMDHNCYWNASGSANFSDRRPDSYYEGDFSGWRNHIAGDYSSILTFPSLDADGYPQEGSPVIDAGVSLSPVVKYDNEGHQRNYLYDMGAYEFGSGPESISLLSYSARGIVTMVKIRWITISETNNTGFNLYRLRAEKINPFISYSPEKINTSLIPGQINSGSLHSYEYTDYVESGSKYFYILESLSTSGVINQYSTRLVWLM